MTAHDEQANENSVTDPGMSSGSLRVALVLAAMAAVGAGFAISQLFERRLSKPEIARLKFYRYLREKGHLES
jgi:hypothetical protein